MPVYNEADRQKILLGLKCVDEVFLEESLELKRSYILKCGAATLVMGDDWSGIFDDMNDICDVVYLPRTPSISTTEIIEVVASKRIRG